MSAQLPFDEGAGPSEAAAEGDEKNFIPFLEIHFGSSFMQSDGDAGGGHIPVAVDVDETAFARKLQLLHQGIDDADVGLVGDDAFNIVQLNPSFF